MSVTIAAVAYHTPPHLEAVNEASGLGIVATPTSLGETPSQLALAAAQAALAQAAMPPTAVDVILDYSTLPQEYLTPAWNMSNKLQHELGATNAFTLGFSGGGASNFLVALSAGLALLQTDSRLETALLVGADVALPDNRQLLDVAGRPVTFLGDGAGALLLRRVDAAGPAPDVGRQLLAVELLSQGENHDICFIPGGALAHPNRPDLYRLQLDGARYAQTPRYTRLAQTATRLLERVGVGWDSLAGVITTNLSIADQLACRAALQAVGWPAGRFFGQGEQAQLGHLQGTDFIVNLQAAAGRLRAGDLLLLCSHGMGFLYGAALLRETTNLHESSRNVYSVVPHSCSFV